MVPIPYTMSGVLIMIAQGMWQQLGPYLVAAAGFALLLRLLDGREIATLE
jgi:hypothetical protein